LERAAGAGDRAGNEKLSNPFTPSGGTKRNHAEWKECWALLRTLSFSACWESLLLQPNSPPSSVVVRSESVEIEVSNSINHLSRGFVTIEGRRALGSEFYADRRESMREERNGDKSSCGVINPLNCGTASSSSPPQQRDRR